MITLTPKEQEIYAFICDIYNWRAPTNKQIMNHMKYKRDGFVSHVIRRLQEKGLLDSSRRPYLMGKNTDTIKVVK